MCLRGRSDRASSAACSCFVARTPLCLVGALLLLVVSPSRAPRRAGGGGLSSSRILLLSLTSVKRRPPPLLVVSHRIRGPHTTTHAPSLKQHRLVQTNSSGWVTAPWSRGDDQRMTCIKSTPRSLPQTSIILPSSLSVNNYYLCTLEAL